MPELRSDEDLVQEALVIIYEKYKDIEFDRGVLPWAYGVLDKIVSSHYRTNKRRQQIISQHREDIIKLHNHVDSTEDKYASSELAAEIWYALNHLNRTEKAIFKLKMEGASGDEIVERLGISRSTLDVSVFRGRKKLRKKLEKRGVL